jgi:hypothetical protein
MCKTTFHVSCGLFSGCKFYLADWPLCVYFLCDKHVTSDDNSVINKVCFFFILNFNQIFFF